ncbi:hypothetical protein [Streptomyces sp. ODS05-4]|uniref:hypothetical protein n=1 Tax=Streptomyces sp. ODS05-4 TaxID=2944939 RepID=UPI00387ED3B3
MAGGTVRGEESQPPLKRGPRHAAPRKSLLSKIQAPAGKAMALAAMPTAVLVGFGLTPKLALADDKDIPFAPGPCVTRSDEPDASESPSASKSPEPSKSPEASPSPSASESAAEEDSKPSPADSPSADESAKGSAKDSAKDSGDDEARRKETAPASESPKPSKSEPARSSEPSEPEPSESESRHPLDPLGVGNAIDDLFGGITGKGREKEQGQEADEPTATPSSKAAESSEKPSAEPEARDKPSGDKPAEDESRDKPSEDGSADESPDESRDEQDTPGDRTEQAIKDAAEKAGAEVEELPEKAKGTDPTEDEDIPEGAKPRFPCPTADPEALAAAKAEPGIPLLADEPWRLESSRLTLSGLDYHGIVEVQTGSGKIKKVLKFTSESVDIKDLHQRTVHSEGRTGHVTSRPGSTSTIRGGTVTMYTEELKGKLFGLIPITFSPETPPPLNVPFAFFTDVQVIQAGQFGGTLKVPGLGNYIEE